DPIFLAVVRFHILVGVGCCGRRDGHAQPQGSRLSFFVLNDLLLVLDGGRRYGDRAFGGPVGRLLSPILSRHAVLAASPLARLALRQRWRHWVRLHMTSMGMSYILMLTAFYVDNGKHLPLWKELPQISFWLLPAGLGIPLLRALLNHPLAWRERLTSEIGPHD